MQIIKRALRGTSFIVTLVLDETQARHFKAAEGERPAVPAAMDPGVMREMINLAAHLKEIGSFDHREKPLLRAHDVWEALETVKG